MERFEESIPLLALALLLFTSSAVRLMMFVFSSFLLYFVVVLFRRVIVVVVRDELIFIRRVSSDSRSLPREILCSSTQNFRRNSHFVTDSLPD